MQTEDTENRDWKSMPTDYTNQLGLRKAQKAEKKKWVPHSLIKSTKHDFKLKFGLKFFF